MNLLKNFNSDERKIAQIETALSETTFKTLPATVITYPFQTGGHGKDKPHKIPILYDSDNAIIFKSFQRHGKGLKEAQFYLKVFQNKPADTFNELQILKRFLPKFAGIFLLQAPKMFFLGLYDFLNDIKVPNVCDIKLGRISYEPSASPKKKETEIAKYKWRWQIGFLITGILIQSPLTRERIFLDKHFGQSLDQETVYTEGLLRFLGNAPEARRLTARTLQGELESLIGWFRSQTQLRFYGSSIILAYDSAPRGPRPASASCPAAPFCVVKLVDFAHWECTAHEADENCLFGLLSLRDYLLRVLATDHDDDQFFQPTTSPFSFKRSHSTDSSLDLDKNSQIII